MKAIRLDFVPDRRWRWCWSVGLLVCGLIAGATFWPIWSLYQQKLETIAAIDRVSQSLRSLREPPSTGVDPQYASAMRAAHLLQTDLNPLFATIEGLQQPGTKLSSLNVDLAAGSARVEYTADAVKSATELAARLNDGYSTGPWRLESVSAVPAALGSNQAVRAVWLVRLSDLK